MARIDGQRREDGVDLVAKEIPGPRCVMAGEICDIPDEDVVFREGGEDFLVPKPVNCLGHLVDELLDGVEDLGRGHAVGPDVRGAAVDLLLDAGDANLEELVEVRRENREELHAFHEGLPAVLGLFEDPPVELEPAQFPVNEVFWVRKVIPHSPRDTEKFEIRNSKFEKGADARSGRMGGRILFILIEIRAASVRNPGRPRCPNP